jgi:hypothetical protein
VDQRPVGVRPQAVSRGPSAGELPSDRPDLADLQRFVRDSARAATPIADDPASAARAEGLVAPGVRGMKPAARLEIYREQFWLRHLASLDEDFPTLTWVLARDSRDGGREAFRQLARRYLEAFPPRSWDLQRLGADLPDYLLRDPRWKEDALAHDAARLDWAFMHAFDAADSPPFDPRVLASAPEDAWPSARIDLHASIRCLSLGYPVHELRHAVQHGEARDAPEAAATHLVVHRDPRCFLHAVAVEPLALKLLEALRSQTPLGAACEAAARTSGSDPLAIGEKLGAWFQQWTAAGWIRAVRFDV